MDAADFECMHLKRWPVDLPYILRTLLKYLEELRGALGTDDMIDLLTLHKRTLLFIR
jgi:hypothetical protein